MICDVTVTVTMTDCKNYKFLAGSINNIGKVNPPVHQECLNSGTTLDRNIPGWNTLAWKIEFGVTVHTNS